MVGRSVGLWGSKQGCLSVLTVLTLTVMILVAGLYRDVCGRPVSGPVGSIQGYLSVLTVLTLTAMILVAGLYRDVCGRPVSGSVGINTG